MVTIHAATIPRATCHRTALVLWIEPTPAIAPAIACVLETGRPSQVAKRMEMAAPVSAQKPLRGFSLVSLVPMVRTIRQPPLKVPRAIAVLDAAITQVGTLKSFWIPAD